MRSIQEPAKNSFTNRYKIAVDLPATYRIQIIGELEDDLPECLTGSQITLTDQGNRQTITTLSGTFPNQTVLFDVLMVLYDMRLPLLSVFCFEESESPY